MMLCVEVFNGRRLDRLEFYSFHSGFDLASSLIFLLSDLSPER